MIGSVLANLSDCVYGQIIVEPVITEGVVICNPGTPFTSSLKRKFVEHNIQTVKVEPIYGLIALHSYPIDKLDNMLLKGLRVSNPNDVYRFASSLVKDAVENKFAGAIELFSSDDAVTIKHSMRVARLATTYAILSGKTDKIVKAYLYGSLLHDVGKAYIPISILNKKGKLTKEEYAHIKMHPQFGGLWCKMVYDDLSHDAVSIIMQHHENHDGTGYPLNLRGFEINKLASIVHIIDVYDAIADERPYKGPVNRVDVLKYLISQSGKMFDPVQLNKYIKVMPKYFVGEEIRCNHITGIVSDTTNKDDPLIIVGKDVVPLSLLNYASYNASEVHSIVESLYFKGV